MKECIYITKTCYSHDNQLPGKLSTNERGNNFLEKKNPAYSGFFLLQENMTLHIARVQKCQLLLSKLY